MAQHCIKGKRIRRVCIPKEYDIDKIQIGIPVLPNGFFKYEDQTISAKPGDIFLIQPNVLHAIMSDEHSSFFL